MPKIAPTKLTLELSRALTDRGIRNFVEYWDGHKHVDIHLPDLKINIEINGVQHYTNPKQILADFKRAYFSDKENIPTFAIANEVLEKHFEEVVGAVCNLNC